MKLSVIIPCYNAEKYIYECFESVTKQTIGMENLQVICVNDASTDKTWDMIQEFKKAYPAFVLDVNLNKNIKQGGARNIGLRYATGKYVAFLDADDWLDETMCEKVYEKAEEFHVDILQFPFIHVYSKMNQVKDNSFYYGFIDASDYSKRKELLVELLFTLGSQNKIYRRTFLEENHAFFIEGHVYEEPYFVYPLLFEAERCYNMEEGLYYYRQTEPSVTGKYMNQKTKLYDHPFVQLELLKKLTKNKNYLQEYYSEIEFHFLKSYYIETLYFAGVKNIFLGEDYFRNMQNMIKELFPSYAENPYIQLDYFRKCKIVLESVNQKFTQKELEQYCKEVASLFEM